MTITELEEKDRPAWDTYVRKSTHGLPQHLSGWRDILEKCYGYETCYLMATDDGRVVGVLPLFFVRSFLVGSSATTMPGGLCADDTDVGTALIARGKEIARQAKLKRLVIQDTRQAWPGDLYTTSDHVSWVVDVRAGADAVWKALHKNIRRQVRMARNNGLTVEIDRTGERLAEFHDVLSRFAHQVGTPLFGRDFPQRVVETFPGEFTITVVYQEKQPVGAYFSLVMRNRSWGTWGGTLHEYLKQRAVYLAYWEVLNDAAASGYHFVDMGRSPAGSGPSKFKGQWGGVSIPIYQQVAAIGNEQPDAGIVERVKKDTKLQFFMQIWPKLPFPVAQFLGPKLRRHVPFA